MSIKALINTYMGLKRVHAHAAEKHAVTLDVIMVCRHPITMYDIIEIIKMKIFKTLFQISPGENKCCI